MKYLLLATTLLIASFSSAQNNKYLTKAEQIVNWNPDETANKTDVAFSGTVRVTLDVFFGDPTEQHVAGKYQVGSYVIYKGQKIYTSSLPADVKAKIKISSVDIAYDIQNKSGTVVSTKKATTVLDFDMAGSPNWKDMFPGLSAEQAKQLFKDGFSIVNVRITKANVSVPNLDAYVNGGVKPPTSSPNTNNNLNFEQVGYVQQGDSIFIKTSNGNILRYKICSGNPVQNGGNNSGGNYGGGNNSNVPVSGTCMTPNISAEAATYCIKFKWSSCPSIGATMTSDGKMLGKNPEYSYVIIQYRKKGDVYWKSLKGRGGCVLPTSEYIESGVEPCTQYEFQIQAFCDNNTASQVSTMGTVTTACFAPVQVTATDIAQTSVGINFRRTVSNAAIFSNTCWENGYEDYVVEYSSDGGMNWKSFNYHSGGLKIYNLDSGTNYKVRLKTKFSNGKFSVYSNVVSFTTLK
jgi:hypothetical protein